MERLIGLITVLLPRTLLRLVSDESRLFSQTNIHGTVPLYHGIRELLGRGPCAGETWPLIEFLEIFLHVRVLFLPVRGVLSATVLFGRVWITAVT